MGRPCKVLESVNPHPEKGSYARVLSWIDAEMNSLIRAEAYDPNGRQMKLFSLRHFQKVNGHWQVKDMELLNRTDDSKTVLEFTFEVQP